MKVVVIDGQSGRMGQRFIERARAVLVACRTADIIVGPIGILAADSLLGEITPAMAVAVGQSAAKKLLLPVNQCSNIVVGTQSLTLSKLMEEAVDLLRSMCEE